jgi:hypothetical protein
MPPKISDQIKEIGRLIGEEIDNQTPDMPLTTRVQTGAINALLGGPAERREYMNIFVQTEEELAHLTNVEDADKTRRKARAYLMANGMCGSGTTRHIILNVEDSLDLA